MKRIAFALLLAAACAVVPAVASAQGYPNRPVKIVTPFSPGGGVEVTLRLVAQKMSDSGWPQVVVENRAGGGGAIAAGAVMEAPPDGYTLLQADIGTFAVNPSLQSNLAYDPLADFKPITLMWSFPSLVIVPTTSPANSIAELVDYARKKPGGLTYASQGTGSGGHVLGAMFAKELGVPMTHVPYRGAGPAVTDLAAGRADLMFTTLASTQAFIADGRLKAIGTTSRQRPAGMPNLMTMQEAGFPNVYFDAWFGIAGPRALPDAIVGIVRDKVTSVMRDPEIVQKLNAQGFDVVVNSPEEFRRLIKAELDRLSPLLKAADAKAN
jgi:tripartite-type tricarboxylate transporter receptor subunit TctC